jgi:protein arginine kinase
VPDEAIRRGAPWLAGTGPHADVVVSSRLRLARNLAGFPFGGKSTIEQRQQLLALMHECLPRIVPAAGGEPLVWCDVHKLSQFERMLLVERHLISKEHAKGHQPATSASGGGPGTPAGGGGAGALGPVVAAMGSVGGPADAGPSVPRAVAFSLPEESLSIMVNEEDHLRLQVLQSGLALGKAWELADAVDDQLEAMVEYAFAPRFGYLTACPTNVGCGVRMSAMLHLPALKLTGEMDKVKKACRDMQLAVRGFYGEGSEAAGDLFQISNQTTLGKSEPQILNDLSEDILPQVIGYERLARQLLLEKRRRTLEDQVFRALGTLRHARLLSPDEALTLLSLVRLGVLTGLITDLTDAAVLPLFLLTQPAHLQRMLGCELDQQARREARADLVRQRLTVA